MISATWGINSPAFEIRPLVLTILTGRPLMASYFSYTSKKRTMGNLLYIIAVILIIAWAIGFLGYSAGGLIHILLVIAIIAILIRVIRGSGV